MPPTSVSKSPTAWFQLIQNQRDRDDNIKALALSMRDMLASLSEINGLEKIKTLQSVIVDAMTRICECTDFIEAYVKHGFWGEFAHHLPVEMSH